MTNEPEFVIVVVVEFGSVEQVEQRTDAAMWCLAGALDDLGLAEEREGLRGEVASGMLELVQVGPQ